MPPASGKGLGAYFKEMVNALLAVIESCDVSIRSNSERIAKNCIGFARHLKLPKKEIDQVYLAGLLHDIGMFHIPQEIIQKKEADLSEGEMAMVKMHPEIAEKILSNLSFLKGILPVVKHHHERVDGSGYPDGLKGNDIPLGARLLTIVDSYDAMVSGRPYCAASSMDEALREIEKCAGKHFDETLAKKFVEYMRLSVASEAATKQSSAMKEKESVRDIINKIIEKFKKDQINLPVLPKVINDIQRSIRNPTSTADDIAKLIERDAVISLRLITTANSPMYRGADKIQTVRQAVPRLGLKQTQSIVNAIANKNLYQTENETFMELMRKLWLHSLASAYAAKSIAKHLSYEDEEKYFLMGLSHDIGKVLLLKAIDVIAKEADKLNIDELLTSIQDAHTDFGSALLQRWKFPGEFSRVAKMHDDKEFYEATQEAILVVNLASNLSRTIGYAPEKTKEEEQEEEIVLTELKSTQLLSIESETLDEICEEIKKIMQESAHIF